MADMQSVSSSSKLMFLVLILYSLGTIASKNSLSTSNDWVFIPSFFSFLAAMPPSYPEISPNKCGPDYSGSMDS